LENHDTGRFIHTLLGLQTVHSNNITGEGVRLAIIEQQYNAGHAAFTDIIGPPVCTTDLALMAKINHGTAVVGTAVGKRFDSQYHPKYPYPGGVAPGATWKVFDDYDGEPTALLRILNYIASGKDGKYDVITISSGGNEPDPDTDKGIRAVIAKLSDQGTVIFASSGNEGDQDPMVYPASLRAVISVGFLTTGAKVAGSSKESNVDVYCYGQEIIAPHGNGNEFYVHSGSSIATPAVAGLACLAFQCARSHPVPYAKLHHIDKMKAMLNTAMRKRGEKYVLEPANFLIKAKKDKSLFEELQM
jgi:hypothetical protein